MKAEVTALRAEATAPTVEPPTVNARNHAQINAHQDRRVVNALNALGKNRVPRMPHPCPTRVTPTPPTKPRAKHANAAMDAVAVAEEVIATQPPPPTQTTRSPTALLDLSRPPVQPNMPRLQRDGVLVLRKDPQRTRLQSTVRLPRSTPHHASDVTAIARDANAMPDKTPSHRLKAAAKLPPT